MRTIVRSHGAKSMVETSFAEHGGEVTNMESSGAFAAGIRRCTHALQMLGLAMRPAASVPCLANRSVCSAIKRRIVL